MGILNWGGHYFAASADESDQKTAANREILIREMGEIPARRQKYDRQGSYEYLSNFVEQMSTSASTCVRLRIFHFGAAAAAAGRVHPHIISQLPETSGPTPNFFNYQTSIIIPGAIILARYQNVPTSRYSRPSCRGFN
jgi:hypothetical protein